MSRDSHGPSRDRDRVVAAAVWVAGIVSGCSCSEPEPCFDDLESDDKLEITVVERYDETSRFPGGFENLGPCNESIGLGSGGTLTATVRRETDAKDGLCTGFLVDLTMPGQTLTLRPGDYGGGPELAGHYDADDRAGCRAKVYFGLVFNTGSKQPFPVVPVAAQRPPTFMLINYTPDTDAGCPATCETRLVVSVEKL